MTENYLWKRRHEVLYTARLNRLYHRKREKFFEVVDRCIKATSIIAGSGALYRSGTGLMEPILLGVVVLTTISLVFGLSERAARHARFAADYGAIEAEINRTGERTFKEENINQWDGALSALGAAEPAALRTLLLVAQNELDSALGHAGQPVSWLRRLCAHMV